MHLLYVSHHCQKVPSTNPQPYISVQPPLQYSQDTAAAAAAAAASIECIVVKRETFTDSQLLLGVQPCGGEPGSEPQIDVYEETVSSFDMATKFRGAVDNLLISLKYPF